jgi:hypothetical protein
MSDPLAGLEAFVDYGSTDADKANAAAAAVAAASLLGSPNNLDFFSFTSPADVLAPHPDLFESELDLSLAQVDDSQLSLSFLDVDAPAADPFAFLRSETPTHAYRSTPSVVTASSASESASGYDSLSSYSESFYNAAHSPNITRACSDYAFPTLDSLNMDFQRIGIERHAGYATTNELASAFGEDPASFGALPASPPRTHGGIYRPRSRSGAYSDYAPPQRVVPTSAASDYYSALVHARHPSLVGMPAAAAARNGQRTVSPASLSPSSQSGQSDMSVPITPPLPVAPVMSRVREQQQQQQLEDDDLGGPADARRKYKCPNCTRGKSMLPFSLQVLGS